MTRCIAAFQNSAHEIVLFYGWTIPGEGSGRLRIYKYSLQTYQWQLVSRAAGTGYPDAPDAVTAFDVPGSTQGLGTYITATPRGIFDRGLNLIPNTNTNAYPEAIAAFRNHAPGNANHELLVQGRGQMRHHWKDAGSKRWYAGELIDGPDGLQLAALQNTTADHMNYEVVATQKGNLRHWWRDAGTGRWSAGAVLGKADGTGVAMFQNRAPDNANLEVFAVQNGKLRHWWRDARLGTWHRGSALGDASGHIAAFQNNAPGNFNYEVYAVQGDHLRHWWYDFGQRKWYSGPVDVDHLR